MNEVKQWRGDDLSIDTESVGSEAQNRYRKMQLVAHHILREEDEEGDDELGHLYKVAARLGRFDKTIDLLNMEQEKRDFIISYLLISPEAIQTFWNREDAWIARQLLVPCFLVEKRREIYREYCR